MNRAALTQACGTLEFVLCNVCRLRHDGKDLALSVHALGEVEHTALQAKAEAGSEVDEALGGGLFGVSQLEDNGIAVADWHTTAPERVIPVDRGGYSGPVHIASAGATVVEKRGDEVVVMRATTS